jgi:hypothetical protein
MYRVELGELQKHFPCITDDIPVIYCNFVCWIGFEFLLSKYYTVDHVVPRKIDADRTLNVYLAIRGVTRSCFIWLSEDSKNRLVNNYHVANQIFTLDEDK